MSPRPPDLPDFDHPPIDEVAIAVQFASPLLGFTEAHAGLYWQSIKERYPTVTVHPRAAGVIESLEEGGLPRQQFVLQQPLPTLGGMTWLVSADDQNVLQIQSDRFVRNWRHREADYPHFEALLEEFQDFYVDIRQMLAREHIAVSSVQQVEVSYINWIPDMAVSEFLTLGANSALNLPGVDPMPVDQTWTSRYSVRNEQGSLVGRLHTQAQPAGRAPYPGPGGLQTGTIFALSFLAPSITGDMTDDEMTERLLLGRDLIVRAFAALSSPAAHERWGLRA